MLSWQKCTRQTCTWKKFDWEKIPFQVYWTMELIRVAVLLRIESFFCSLIIWIKNNITYSDIDKSAIPTKNLHVTQYKISYWIGFPPEFRVTVYVRKWSGNFFHFHYGKGSGKPEFRNVFKNNFFSIKLKFLERFSIITDCYVPEYCSGNFPENRSRNFRFPEQLVP